MTGIRRGENMTAAKDGRAHLQVVREPAGPSAASMDVPVGGEVMFFPLLIPLS